ncbi:LysR family transcriptional regulator [Marinobacterium jannaschii]|uniref:LysR family transcriptional regulator n=1 Tax=Marinobacterium jannaschii TaxID=64970 RepID=UPI000A64924C|nr:LysR family transcriptional regulator [Marinobacterium jannaschii]
MNLRQLKYFISIVEQGSFLKAAKVLCIAQPALSQHIANLEDELGTQLLIRTPRGVTATPAGEVLYQHAQKISSQLKQAQDDVRLEANSPKGDVAVVLPPMLSIHIAPRLVKLVDEQYPDIQLRAMEARSLKSLAMVESSRADLGVIAGSTPSKTVNTQLLYEEPLYFVEQYPSEGQPKDIDDAISFREVSKKPLAVSQKSHAVRAMLEDLSAKKDLPLNIKLETESTRLIMSFAASGVANAVMPWPSIYNIWEQKKITARKITRPDMVRQVCIAWPKNYPLNTASIIVKDMIFKIIRDLYEEGVIAGQWLSEDQPEDCDAIDQ